MDSEASSAAMLNVDVFACPPMGFARTYRNPSGRHVAKGTAMPSVALSMRSEPMNFRAQRPAFRCYRALMFALATSAAVIVMFAAFSAADTSRHTAAEYAASVGHRQGTR